MKLLRATDKWGCLFRLGLCGCRMSTATALVDVLQLNFFFYGENVTILMNGVLLIFELSSLECFLSLPRCRHSVWGTRGEASAALVYSHFQPFAVWCM